MTARTIRGKTVRQWAEQFGVTKCRVYQLEKAGILEKKIDGKWRPKDQGRKAKPVHGRTYREWAYHLKVKISTCWAMNARGDLERIAKGEAIPNRSAEHYVCGLTLREIQDRLGITRQAVHQQFRAGKLEARVREMIGEERT